MEKSILYLNYCPEIIIIILTFIFSIKRKDIFLIVLISILTYLLIINFLTIYLSSKENNVNQSYSEVKEDEPKFYNICQAIGYVIGYIISTIIVYLLFILPIKFFKNLGRKGRIYFFHILSSLTSVICLYLIFTKYKEKDVLYYLAIAIYIIILSFLIIIPIINQTINSGNKKNTQIQNNKQKYDSSVDNSIFADKNEKDNQTEKNLNHNEANNKNIVLITHEQNLNSNDDLQTKEDIESQTKQ